MSLAEGKFCQALAKRHLPRLMSGIMPLQHMRAMIPRRKRHLDLVYRYLPKGAIIWNSFRLMEKFLLNSIRNMTYVFLPPTFSGRISGKDASDRRWEESKPIISSPGQILLSAPVNKIVPEMSMASILAPMRFRFEDKSLNASAKGENREPSRPGGKGWGSMLNLIPCHGYYLVNSCLIQSSQDIMPHGTNESSPEWTKQGFKVHHLPIHRNQIHDLVNPSLMQSAHVIMRPGTNESPLKRMVPRTLKIYSESTRQGREDYVQNNRNQSHDLLSYSLFLSSRAMMQSWTNESSPERTKQGLKVHHHHIHRNQIHDLVNSSLMQFAQVIMRPGTNESPLKGMVPRNFEISSESTRQGREDYVQNNRNQSHDLLSSSLFLSSRAMMLSWTNESSPKRTAPRTFEISPAGIMRGGKVHVPNHRNQSHDHVNPCLILSSRALLSPGCIGNLPLTMKQRPGIDISHDVSAGPDRSAVQTAWANRRYQTDMPPSVLMEFKALPLRSVGKEIRLEDARWRDDSKPPSINMSKISDQVYSMIERKIKIERERRGIYV